MKKPLHRNDPKKDPLPRNTKVTKQDWMNVAIDTLISDGIEQVKVMTLAENLSVSRSSFYWYFRSRQDLLDNLLDHWLTLNTAALVSHAKMPCDTINEGVCNLHLCFVDPSRFDTKLDFAVRDWARRSGKVRRILDTSDARRIDAIGDLFQKFGYSPRESLVRARVLYYMQIGYNDADLQEPLEARLSLVPDYLLTFTGQMPTAEEVEEFTIKMQHLDRVN